MPTLEFVPPPTPEEIAEFAPAEPDSRNKGVLDANGNCLAPRYPHHVDDNMCGDILRHMERTVGAGLLGICHILGFPDPRVPNAISWDKFLALHGFTRKMVGWLLNTRKMNISMLEERREMLLALLATWVLTRRTQFTLQEISILHGTLESASHCVKWTRPLFCALQNAVRMELECRCHILKRRCDKSSRAAKIKQKLPAALAHRADQLIAKDKAQLLWDMKAKMNMTPHIQAAVDTVYHFLADPTNEWAESVTCVIPRDPHMVSHGDASFDAGGAFCEKMCFWFDIRWSPHILRGVRANPSHPDCVHVNALEFIMVILQLAAVMVHLDEARADPTSRSASFFPSGMPARPVLLSRTDNTVSEVWTSKLTSKSLIGQNLLSFFAAMLRTQKVGANALHLEGALNQCADFMSRPADLSLSFHERCEQIFQKYSSLRTWDCFQLSPELLRSLSSLLCSRPSLGLPDLPKTLGRFATDVSTVSASPTL